jgi:hypothetical protein
MWLLIKLVHIYVLVMIDILLLSKIKMLVDIWILRLLRIFLRESSKLVDGFISSTDWTPSKNNFNTIGIVGRVSSFSRKSTTTVGTVENVGHCGKFSARNVLGPAYMNIPCGWCSIAAKAFLKISGMDCKFNETDTTRSYQKYLKKRIILTRKFRIQDYLNAANQYCNLSKQLQKSILVCFGECANLSVNSKYKLPKKRF